MNWQPIDTAPVDGTRVLLADDSDRFPYIGKFMPDWGIGGLWVDDGSGAIISTPDEQPDWWAPIPALPAGNPKLA